MDMPPARTAITVSRSLERQQFLSTTVDVNNCVPLLTRAITTPITMGHTASFGRIRLSVLVCVAGACFPYVILGLYAQSNQTTTNVTSNETSSNSTNLCFQPNDAGCNDAVLPPVICPEQTNTTCALICSQTASCVSDTHGSFCKLDNNVCFGLYWTNANHTSACFQPNDPSCPSDFPITCSGGAVSGGTTSSPSSTESSGSTIVTQTETEETETTATTDEPETTESTTESSSSSELPSTDP